MRSKIWGHLSHPRTCEQLSRPQAGPLKLILLLWNGHPLTAKWDPPFIKYHYININNNNHHHHHHPRMSDANSATTEVPQPACRRSCHRSRWEPLPDDLQRPFRFKLFRPLGLAWTRLDPRLVIAWPLVVGCRGSQDLERSGRSEVTCCGTMKRLEGPTMRWPWQETISWVPARHDLGSWWAFLGISWDHYEVKRSQIPILQNESCCINLIFNSTAKFRVFLFEINWLSKMELHSHVVHCYRARLDIMTMAMQLIFGTSQWVGQLLTVTPDREWERLNGDANGPWYDWWTVYQSVPPHYQPYKLLQNSNRMELKK